MEKVQLKNICRPKQWKTLTGKNLVPDGKYPVYGANGIIGYYNDYNHENETLMIGCRGTCGALNISQPFSYINGNAMALDDLVDDIDIRYLYYALMGRGFQDVISGAVQPQIIRADLEKMEVWIGNKKEQKEIVDVFSKLDAVLSHRKREIQYLDDLIKARFVEMFGDCKELITLKDLCSIITDGTHQPPQFQDSGIPFILVSNLSQNTVTYDTKKYISEETYNELIKRTPIEVGDVLLSTVGSYGHPAVVTNDKKFLFQRHIAYLKPKRDIVNSFYLHGALLAPDAQRQIEEKVKGIAQKTLNLSEIKKIVIPIPSIECQNAFEQFVAQVDKSKATVQKALDETQLLFDSLMQQYFG